MANIPLFNSNNIVGVNLAATEYQGYTLQAGSNVEIVYNDDAKTITFNATGDGFPATAYSDLSDVQVSGLANHSLAVYETSMGKWINRQLHTTGALIQTYSSGVLTLHVPVAATQIDELTDVTVTAVDDGHVLAYEDGGWRNKEIVGGSGVTITHAPTSIEISATGSGGAASYIDLDDVTITSLANNQIPRYDSVSGDWKNISVVAGANVTITHASGVMTIAATGSFTTALAVLSDVDVAGVTDGSIIRYDTIAEKWKDVELQAGSNVTITNSPTGIEISSSDTDALSELSDVTLTSLSNNQLIRSNAGNWENVDIIAGSNVTVTHNAGSIEISSAASSSLSSLTDVIITSTASGDVLMHNGTDWVDGNINAGAGISVTIGSGTLTITSDVTLSNSVTLTNKTISGALNTLSNIPSSALSVMSSADLRGILTDESGTGAAVFQNGALGNATYTHIESTSSTPTISAGTGAGTAPTISVSGTDHSMQITLTTGAAPAANATICTVTFSQAFSSTRRPVYSPANQAAAILASNDTPYCDGASTTTFILSAGTSALNAATTYKWNVIVL